MDLKRIELPDLASTFISQLFWSHGQAAIANCTCHTIATTKYALISLVLKKKIQLLIKPSLDQEN
ncbi:hypothetical protein BpHYR1_046953 [Brachionus plicatilis]|uniref:Uncharacterized protein n=1 Tax=Brachionus plicatilis TaxID=10195 RepID=A0A3M7PIY1_BRAPC|nr:hypothetical protein BpHYR1_046953 [Brachionus plicatilis]